MYFHSAIHLSWILCRRLNSHNKTNNSYYIKKVLGIKFNITQISSYFLLGIADHCPIEIYYNFTGLTLLANIKKAALLRSSCAISLSSSALTKVNLSESVESTTRITNWKSEQKISQLIIRYTQFVH